MTFSVRAAGELRLRLAEHLGEEVAAAVTAATFHSLCARMLREDAALFGRTEDYTIYDQADMRHVIEWLLSNRLLLFWLFGRYQASATRPRCHACGSLSCSAAAHLSGA